MPFSYTTCTDLYDSPKSYPNSHVKHRSCETICKERHFRTAPVRICTAPRSRTETAHLGYVYTNCTKLGGPVGPCATGIRLRVRSCMFTRPWQTIGSERHFRTAPVRICAAPQSPTRTAQLGCVYKLQITGSNRCILNTRCTTPRPLTDVHQVVEYNVQ